MVRHEGQEAQIWYVTQWSLDNGQNIMNKTRKRRHEGRTVGDSGKTDTGFYNNNRCDMFHIFGSMLSCVLTEVSFTTAVNVLFSKRHSAQCVRFVSLYHNLVEIRGCCYCTWCQSDCFYWGFTFFILFPLSAQSSSRERPGHCYVSRGHLSVLADSS